MARCFLIDGTALAYRSHFAFVRSGLSTADGRATGATYGFTMALRRILEQEQPDKIAVALDPPGPTFRHARYADYKATREKVPEDMVDQLDWIREVVRAHGVTIFEVPGFEADDVIGTLAVEGAARGDEVFLVTGDKDFMQLVTDRVRLYNIFKPGVDLAVIGPAEVEEKFGVGPQGVVDVLAIMGDASDNVPGVKGIGEKGAIKLMQEFGSVAALLERLDEVKGKQQEKIEHDREMLLLSRELITIDTAVPLDPGYEALGPAEPDPAALHKLFTELEFQSLADQASSGSKGERNGVDLDYVTVRDEAGLDALVAELSEAGKFSIDTETTSLFPLECELVGISFSTAAGKAWYVPANLDPPIVPGGTPALLARLGGVLTDPHLARIGQNTKYDWLVFRHHGIQMPPPDFDTMVASFCIAGSDRRHNLDALALYYFGMQKIPTTELIGKGKQQITMADVPIDQVAEYACEDADVTWRLYERLAPELAQEGAEALFHDLEMPLVPVLTAMEQRGIRLDTKKLELLGQELEKDHVRLVRVVQELAGENVNVASPKALGEVLFEKLRIQDEAGVKRPKRTKTAWATDAETLQTNYGEVEIVRTILETREVSKLRNTYVDSLPSYVNPATGRVHCSFSQVSAATGRLASSEPNLQNIPIRTERGRRIRDAFVAREPDARGRWCLVAADYSQIELRVLAHLSKDRHLIRAFEEGQDIHAATACRIFDVEPFAITREMRSQAKVVNFGLLYGMGPQRLARETGFSVPEARKFIERYFASFPTVKGWMESVLEEARRTGAVETLLGRRRRIRDIDSANSRLRSLAENAAVNTPVQGSAADIIKRAMIDLEATLTDSPLAAELLLQVHDELVLECPVQELDETIAVVRAAMENAVVLEVPLVVEFGHGDTWLEAH
ncbi:MAG: DNA polymerase I [Planctomycetota bacterium]